MICRTRWTSSGTRRTPLDKVSGRLAFIGHSRFFNGIRLPFRWKSPNYAPLGQTAGEQGSPPAWVYYLAQPCPFLCRCKKKMKVVLNVSGRRLFSSRRLTPTQVFVDVISKIHFHTACPNFIIYPFTPTVANILGSMAGNVRFHLKAATPVIRSLTQ
jgi:hypothetical protein